MTKEAEAPTVPAFEEVPDPNNVPITHVTNAVSALTGGQTVLLNLIGDRMAVGLNGGVGTDHIIAARLRFDLNVARQIRDQLDGYLNGTVTEGPGPNQKLN